jgi:hypothetical protein
MDEAGYVLHEHLNSHGSAIVQIETTLGTNSGTSILKDFTAGEFAVARNSAGALQDTLTAGTLNNTILGTPTVTGGTFTSPVLAGTPVLDVNSAIPFYGDNMSRQAIINGNFDIWQRGATGTPADLSSVFTADRWFDFNSRDGGTLPTLSRTRQNLTPGTLENGYYLSRLTTSGAGSVFGENAQGRYIQRIESGTRYLCGLNKKVTVSFWAKSDIVGKRIGLALQQNYGTGGSPSTEEQIKNTEVFTLTSTLTKYTSTFTTNTLTGKTFGTNNDDYLEINLNYLWGTGYGNTYLLTGVTAESFVGAGYIDIAQVQLCAGDVALPFQPKLFNEELLLCQRYYENSQNYGTPINTASSEAYASAIAWDTNTCLPYIYYKATKRGTVTTNLYAYDGTLGAVKDQSGENITGVSTSGSHQGIYRLTKTSGFTATRWYIFHWEAIAEL